jgi:large subunit ribosomal protein L29
MKAEKIRDLSDEELANQERDFAEQVFRLRFQMATGQTEGLTKLRSLKKDIARIKTIQRQRQLKASVTAKS